MSKIKSDECGYGTVSMATDDPPHACVDGVREVKIGNNVIFNSEQIDAMRAANGDLERRWWAVKDQFYSEETWHMDAQGNVTFHHKSPNERPAWVQDFIDKYMPERK